MKKFYSVACALAITFSAGSALALEKMDSKSKSDVTAQSGVTISLDNVVTDIEVGSAGYTDDDGVLTGGPTSTGGSVYVNVADFKTTAYGILEIDAGTASSDYSSASLTAGAKTATVKLVPTNTSFVRIGLKDMYSSVDKLDINLYAGTEANGVYTQATNGHFGSVQVNDLKTFTTGAIYIYPH